jgi:hypothetical protein
MQAASAQFRRLFAATTVAALVAFSAPAPTALGAGDPVRAGFLHLRLADDFKEQLRSHSVSMRPRSFVVSGGSMDPLTGRGTLKLRGRLTFKHRGAKQQFKKLRVTVGPHGTLRSGRVKLFRLRGHSVTRNGFGANISGVRLTFPDSAADRLNRTLGLRSLHRARAGRLRVSEQPGTVEIISGTATVKPALGPGSFFAKLAAHCVDPGGGVSPISPGGQPGGPGTAFAFPVASGTISPIGQAGVIGQAGGLQIANGGVGLPSGCPASNDVTIRLSGFSSDLGDRLITTRAQVGGPGALLPLDALVDMPIDISHATLNGDPLNHTIVSNGAVTRLGDLGASNLNFVLPQPAPGNPAMQFAPTDLFGTLGISVRVR